MFRPLISRALGPVGFGFSLLCTPHCAMDEANRPPDGKTVETVMEEGVILSAATWTLGWNTEGITFDAAGVFSLTTNLGYRIHIKTGHVVLHQVALIPCPAPATDTTASFSLAIASAWAHAEDVDPSSIETLKMLDVVHPKAGEIGANAFAPARYCQMYWLVARGMDGALSAEGLDLSNRSIYFDGTWERNGESGPLLVDTWWPAGVMIDLKSIAEPNVYASAAAETSVHFAFLGIDLAQSKLFDDIEFVADSEAVVADSILDNIVDHAQLTVDLHAP